MVGLVIVNYNTWELTRRCARSIASTCGLPYMIYIVDNDSPNESYNELTSVFSGDEHVKLLPSGRNGGYGFGLNCGIRVALADGCDAIIASNNDMIYQRGAIELMYQTLMSDAKLGCVGALQITPEGTPFYSAQFAFDTPLRFALSYLPLRGKATIALFHRRIRKQSTIACYCPMGGCYMFRGEALNRIGLYDEAIFMYTEENVCGYKLRQSHYKACLCTQAKVVHQHGASSGHNKTDGKILRAPSNIYYGRHYLKWKPIHEKIYLSLLKLNLMLSGRWNRSAKEKLAATLRDEHIEEVYVWKA